MVCPYCNKEMEIGYVTQDRYAIKWVSKEKSKGGFLDLFISGIKLTSFLEGRNRISMHLCKECRKMLLDLDENKISLD